MKWVKQTVHRFAGFMNILCKLHPISWKLLTELSIVPATVQLCTGSVICRLARHSVLDSSPGLSPGSCWDPRHQWATADLWDISIRFKQSSFAFGLASVG